MWPSFDIVGAIGQVEKSLAYYRDKTPGKLGQYSEIYRNAITAWGQAKGPQVFAYALWDLSDEAVRAELLQQLDSIAKAQVSEPAPAATAAPVAVPSELSELSFDELQGKRSKGASFAKLEKVVSDIKLINEMLDQTEKWAINSSVLRKVDGVRPTLVKEYLKGGQRDRGLQRISGSKIPPK